MCDCDCELSKYERWKRLEEDALREAAEKIRTEPPPEHLDGRFVAYANGWEDGRNEAADLIDPDKENT